MRALFNRLNPFAKKSGHTVDLAQELESRLRRIDKARGEPYKGESDGRFYAQRAGAQGLCLRLDAAAAAQIRSLMDGGETKIHVPADSTIDRVLLGRDATNFRVYDRNFARDLKVALA